MAVDSTVQFKRGKKNDLPYGLEGEPLYCTDTNELYVGQGKDLPPKLINANGTGGSGGGTEIDDNSTGLTTTWSASKINQMFEDLKYTPIKINSFRANLSTFVYEVGTVLSNIVFNWSLSRKATDIILTDCNVQPTDDCTSMKMEVDWVRVYAPVGVTEKEEVQSISLTQNNVSFNVGDDPIDVYYSVNPSTAWDNNVNYESSNVNVATVYGSRITPVGVGTCKITARATNGVTATINVTVAQNTSINAKSITLNKDTLSIYNGTSSTLTATVTPANHTDSVLWKSSNTDVATVSNGVITGINTGNCTVTAYSSADASVKAECSVTVKEAVQLTGHTTSGLTLQLDRNGMTSTTWKNKIDNVALQWKVANNNSTDIAPYMKFDGNSFYWEGANYKDHLTLDRFSNYYDFGESQTVILAGDFTNVINPIISNKAKLSQSANLACMNNNGLTYYDASGNKLGAINLSTSEQNYNINGCIALRYNKQTLRVDTDTMEFTGSTVNNKNTTLSSAFTQGTYPALLGNVATAKIYWKVVLVYNRVLTDAEIGTTMNAITTFLNA